MIKEVIPGEKLTAKTQNEIIQAANGLMQPAGKFVNTPNGSLYPNPTPQFNNMLGRCVETLFQLKFELKQHLSKRTADEDLQTLSAEYALSSVWYGYSMNLGNDFSQLKEQVKLMQPDNDDIFIVGGQGVNGASDSEDGDRLSVHLVGSQMLIDGSDKEGFFDLGTYWKSPDDGCQAIEVQKMQLSTDNTQYGPTKRAFIVRGKNYPSQSVVRDWYKNKYGGEWKVIDAATTTVGYVYNQKLVQLRTGLLFPQAAQEGTGVWVDSEISELHLSSVQTETWTDPDTGEDTTYHQFFGFTDHVLNNYELSDGLDVVVRDYYTTGGNGARTNYISLSGLASKISSLVEVDSWATQGVQRSIDWNTQDNKKYLQLYNFDKNGYDDVLRVNLVYGQHRYATKDGSGEYPDPYVQFVVRDGTFVKYDALDIYAPPIQASDVTDLSTVISAIVDRGCSCDLGPLSAKVDELSSELSDRWKCGGTYDDNCYGYSIGNSSQVLAIDIDNGGLWYESSQTLDWHACELYDQNGADGPGVVSLNWASRQGYDPSGVQAIDWDYRHLYDDAGNLALRWSNRILHDSSQTGALDWENRTLYDSNSHIVADWERQQLLDVNTAPAVDWGGRILYDSQSNYSLNWHTRELSGDWTVNGNLAVQQGATLTIGNTSLSEAQLSALLALI